MASDTDARTFVMQIRYNFVSLYCSQQLGLVLGVWNIWNGHEHSMTSLQVSQWLEFALRFMHCKGGGTAAGDQEAGSKTTLAD